MSWYKRLFGVSRRASPENPAYSLSDPGILGALADSDDGISTANALNVPAVAACVKVLSESVAQLPLRMFRVFNDGRRIRETAHPAAVLLASKPNPVMTWATFFEQQQAQLALWGNSYAQRIFDRNGATRALYPLKSGDVRTYVREIVEDGLPALAKFHEVGSTKLTAENILHVPLMSLDGIAGLSPIAQNRLGLSAALAQQKFTAAMYKNGARLSGTLEHPQRLSKEAATRLRENWSNVYSGAANAGKVAILEEGMKFSALTMPLDDAQFIETVKFTREQIAAMYRVPPHMIGNLDRATFSNIEHQSLEFAVFTLGPYLVKWEQALADALLSPSEVGQYYFRFNMDALLRGDLKSRYDAYAVARQWGWLSVNEIRDLEERNAVTNGEIYLQPSNMAPAGSTPASNPPPNQGA